MSISFEDSTEIDAGILIADAETEALIGVFAGDDDPWVKVPDAPQGSLYLKTTGETYRRTVKVTDGLSTEWTQTESQSSSGSIAFCLTDGTVSNIPTI